MILYTKQGDVMPVILKHIDKIAREKNRDVIFINFNKEVFPSYDYEDYKERNELLQWLDEKHIPYMECGPIASENGWESYRGQLYIDLPIDETNEKYQLLCERLDGPNGTFKIEGVESWVFPLEIAMKNKYHDEPGFWDKWAENF